MNDHVSKLLKFLEENCDGACHDWCEHWSENGCQHPDNPGNKNVADDKTMERSRNGA